MSDYETTPVYRERQRRHRASLLQQATKALLVLVMAVVIAFAFLSLFMLLLFALPGCTTLSAEQQRELALQARGCYCAGAGCDEIRSAAGQAAVAAAGGQVVNITEVRQPVRQPNE